MKNVIIAVIVMVGLGVSVYIYQYTEHQKIEKEYLIQQQIEHEKGAKEKREREERERRASLARKYASRGGRSVMSSAGGGQDLRTVMKEWHYDRYNDEFEIKVEVYWNGSLFRSNNYNVDGVVTCSGDGSGAKFSRSYANFNFKELESTILWVGGITAGILILDELGSQ